MEPDTIRIVLDLRSVGDSITGRASAPGTETREFAGWLGLLAALQALACGTSSRPTPGPP